MPTTAARTLSIVCQRATLVNYEFPERRERSSPRSAIIREREEGGKNYNNIEDKTS